MLTDGNAMVDRETPKGLDTVVTNPYIYAIKLVMLVQVVLTQFQVHQSFTTREDSKSGGLKQAYLLLQEV